MTSTAVELARKLEQAALALCANRQELATGLRALVAEYDMPCAGERLSVYCRCLFCNSDYGWPGALASTYTTLTAACGCTGVGQDCIIAQYRTPDMTGRDRIFGCERKPSEKCYKCRTVAERK